MYPLSAYRFGVKLNQTQLGFMKVSGIKLEVGVEEYQEGGCNDYIHVFPKPSSQAHRIILEKGVYVGENHPFYLVGEHIDHIVVEIYGLDRDIQKTYTLYDCIIVKWEVGALNANDNTLLIDTFELSYGDFLVS